MKFEQWKRRNNINTCVTFKRRAEKKPCTLCGFMTYGTVALDYDPQGEGAADYVEFGQNICSNCAHAHANENWDFLTSQSVRNAYWRSIRSIRHKKMYRMMMLQAIYKRGRAMEANKHYESFAR